VGSALAQYGFRHALDEVEGAVGGDGGVAVGGGVTACGEGEGGVGVGSADGTAFDLHSFAVGGEGYFLEAVVHWAGVGDVGLGASY